MADAEHAGTARFDLPHSFKPNLSLAQALVSVAGALARIMSGSLLFAFWGALTIQVWQSKSGSALRVLGVTGLFLGFSGVAVILFQTISHLVRKFTRVDVKSK